MRNKAVRKLAILVMVSAFLTLVAGSVISVADAEIVEAKSKSYFVYVSTEINGKILYDSRTGVQYWMSDGTENRGVLTPLIDATGKPLLYDEKSDNNK